MGEATYRFSLALESKIWQTVLCHRVGKLIVEERNESLQSIRYHLLDLVGDEAPATFTIADSDWWTSPLVYRHPYLVLEQYGDLNDPAVKSVLIYHVEDGLVKASIPQFQYEGIHHQELVGVDPKDGSVKKSFLLDGLQNDETFSLISPVYYPSGSESCQLVERYLEKESSGIGCEYFEKEDFIIICYYDRLGTKFDRWLQVIKNEQNLFSSKIDEQMEGFASGGFFILDNLLVFIENGKKINVIEI